MISIPLIPVESWSSAAAAAAAKHLPPTSSCWGWLSSDTCASKQGLHLNNPGATRAPLQAAERGFKAGLFSHLNYTPDLQEVLEL